MLGELVLGSVPGCLWRDDAGAFVFQFAQLVGALPFRALLIGSAE